jgi:hypothetical protein
VNYDPEKEKKLRFLKEKAQRVEQMKQLQKFK